MIDTRAALRLFYLVVLGVALTGAGLAARDWLDWWAPFAFAAVAAVELGGVVLSMHADRRRQLGERALAARALSAAVAAGAVLVNFFGHRDQIGQAAFFAGMSALGYSVWLIDSASRRRDHLRAARKLPPTPPVYGLVQWLRHPWVTRRARRLALADPTLGLYESLAAAERAVRAARRQAAISAALHDKIRAAVNPTMATIAVTVYDLDEVAARLTATADYDGLTELLAADLRPVSLVNDTDEDVSPLLLAAATNAALAAALETDTEDDTEQADDTEQRGGEYHAAPRAESADGAPSGVALAPADARRIARALKAVEPDITPGAIAGLVGKSRRQVERYLNGHQPQGVA